jgi:hypothetical protein
MKLLDWKQFIGGADQIISLDMFPKEQRKFTYQFGNTSVSGYTWDIDYQTVVVNNITFNRTTGEPNYANSTIVGYFDVQQANVAQYVDTSDAANGNVTVTIPADRYTGNILPNARTKVPTTCFSVKWTDTDSPATTNIHRYIITERYTAEVTIGDPTLETSAQGGFTALDS